MEFGVEKCAMLKMKSGNKTKNERYRSAKSKESERSEKRKITCTLEYWKQTPADKWRRKKNISKEFVRRTRKCLENKICSKSLIKEMNNF